MSLPCQFAFQDSTWKTTHCHVDLGYRISPEVFVIMLLVLVILHARANEGCKLVGLYCRERGDTYKRGSRIHQFQRSLEDHHHPIRHPSIVSHDFLPSTTHPVIFIHIHICTPCTLRRRGLPCLNFSQKQLQCLQRERLL